LEPQVQSGYATLGSLRDTPIRIHWTTPLGALFFSSFRFAPGAWVGFVVLVLVHEMGHALLAFRYGIRVLGIDIHAFGGQCRLEGDGTRRQHIMIAWGGVLAQAALLALSVSILRRASTTPFALEMADTLVETNLWLIALNLLPVPPLDGALAWQLFSAGHRQDWLERPQRVNPGPPEHDWFGRSRARPRRKLAKEIHALRAVDAGEPRLPPEDEERIRRLFEGVGAGPGK
jgi:membrane-associated protease RseP (regulator of RpoE activity)